jgi:hypothetical protein
VGPARRRGHRGGAGVRAVVAALLSLLALPSVATPVAAAPTAVIYRCTAADGSVALQDEPCPRGQKQELREIAAFAPPPAPSASSLPASEANGEPTGGSAGSPPPGITPGEAAPPRRSVLPPPLWRCTDLNGTSRLSDTYDPQPRCVPLSVLGVDLSRAPPSAATLCRTVEDACVELGGEAACAAWEERLADAESALRHAFSDTQATRRRERDRAKAVVENDCRD